MERCVFCDIVAGTAESVVLWQDDYFAVILDKYPSIPGQVLIISKQHEQQGFSRMKEDTAIGFVKAAKRLADVMKKSLGCEEVTFAIEGLDVRHAHAKVFPVYNREEYIREIIRPGRELSKKELDVILDKFGKGE